MTDDGQNPQFTQSFLDVIACAFGAVVLLLLILPIGEPQLEARQPAASYDLAAIQAAAEAAQSKAAAAAEARQALVNEIGALDSEMAALRQGEASRKARLSQLEAELRAKARLNQALETRLASQTQQGQARAAARTRLQNQSFGIPVDSDYVLFVIDTSGSMRNIQRQVSQMVEQILDAYPKLKGIQVIDADGVRLAPSSSRLWFADSFAMRKQIARELRNFHHHSSSSPIRGIQEAFDKYLQKGKKTAIFVMGDDYQGRDFDAFLAQVDGMVRQRGVNPDDLRLHAVGFEHQAYLQRLLNLGSGAQHPERFAMLMRALTHQYKGVYLHVGTGAPTRLHLDRPL